jgi:hypothetical protein
MCTQLPNVEALPTALKSQFTAGFVAILLTLVTITKLRKLLKRFGNRFMKAEKLSAVLLLILAGEIMIIQSIYIPKKTVRNGRCSLLK